MGKYVAYQHAQKGKQKLLPSKHSSDRSLFFFWFSNPLLHPIEKIAMEM